MTLRLKGPGTSKNVGASDTATVEFVPLVIGSMSGRRLERFAARASAIYDLSQFFFSFASQSATI